MNRIVLIVCLSFSLGCASQVQQTGLTDSSSKLVKVNSYKAPEQRSKTLDPDKPMRPAQPGGEKLATQSQTSSPAVDSVVNNTENPSQTNLQTDTQTDTQTSVDDKKCSGDVGPNPCPNAAVKEWLQSIDNTYKQLLEASTPVERDRLINSQNQWWTFYAAEKQFIYELLIEDNALDVSVYQDYVEELAKERAQDLLRYLIKGR